MSKFDKLLGMAAKALDGGSARPAGNGAGGTDWRSIVRGAADALTGDRQEQRPADRAPGAGSPSGHGRAGSGADAADRRAIARYDYLMQTADPRQVEQIHREAFERLTPAQRSQVRARMDAELTPHERPRSAEPGDLARSAARGEAMRPGSTRGLLARVGGRGALAGAGAGAAAGGLAAGGVLAAVAGGAVVSSVAGPLLEQAAGLGVDFDALASGIDVEAIAGVSDLAAGADELAAGVGDQLSGLGEQASSFGEQVTNFDLRDLGGLGDVFGR